MKKLRDERTNFWGVKFPPKIRLLGSKKIFRLAAQIIRKFPLNRTIFKLKIDFPITSQNVQLTDARKNNFLLWKLLRLIN